MNLSLEITRDAPILAGAEVAILKLVATAGLDGRASADLAGATREACAAAFALARPGEPICVAIRVLADKIEIDVEHRGEPDPAAGLDTFLGAGGAGVAGLALLSRVDGIQYRAANGVSRTTLTKKRPAVSRT